MLNFSVISKVRGTEGVVQCRDHQPSPVFSVLFTQIWPVYTRCPWESRMLCFSWLRPRCLRFLSVFSQEPLVTFPHDLPPLWHSFWRPGTSIWKRAKTFKKVFNVCFKIVSSIHDRDIYSLEIAMCLPKHDIHMRTPTDMLMCTGAFSESLPRGAEATNDYWREKKSVFFRRKSWYIIQSEVGSEHL